MSFGPLSGFPSNSEARTVVVPSCSILYTERDDQPATINRPSRSNVIPFAWALGDISFLPGLCSQIASPIISTRKKRFWRRSQTAPSPKVKTCATVSRLGTSSPNGLCPGNRIGNQRHFLTNHCGVIGDRLVPIDNFRMTAAIPAHLCAKGHVEI